MRVLKRYRGPVAWVNEEDGVPESGFYALTKNGKDLAKPLKRLVAVQHKGRDSHHYRVAKADEHSPPIGNVIEIELEATGKGQVEA
jgi:hypothetical protein